MDKISFSNTPDHGLVAFLVDKYHASQDRPRLGRTTLQKLCYLSKAKGVPFSLNFDIQHYGPFSAELFAITDDLIADGVISDHSESRQSSQYEPGPACKLLLKKQESMLNKEKSRLNQIISFLREVPPQELELVTTIHYIYCTQKMFRTPEKKRVVKIVLEIKKGKFKREIIESSFHALHNAGLLTWSPRTSR